MRIRFMAQKELSFVYKKGTNIKTWQSGGAHEMNFRANRKCCRNCRLCKGCKISNKDIENAKIKRQIN